MIPLLLAGLLALSGPEGPAQETLEPARHPWMAWPPGSGARYRILLELGAVRQEGAVSYTLAESGPRGYALKVLASQLDKELSSEQRDDVPLRDGSENLTVGGLQVPSTSWKSRGLRGGLVCESRLWLRADGGAPVRLTSKIDGQEDLLLSAVALEDVLKAAGRDLPCVRLEGRDARKGHAVEAWFSAQVPGGLVKMVTRAKVNGQDLVSTLELVEIVQKK